MNSKIDTIVSTISADKKSTSAGIALAVVLLLKAFKIDLGEISGVPLNTVVEAGTAIVSIIFNLISKVEIRKKDKSNHE